MQSGGRVRRRTFIRLLPLLAGLLVFFGYQIDKEAQAQGGVVDWLAFLKAAPRKRVERGILARGRPGRRVLRGPLDAAAGLYDGRKGPLKARRTRPVRMEQALGWRAADSFPARARERSRRGGWALACLPPGQGG